MYRRPTFKCEDAINANAIFSPDSQLLETQSTYYARITYVLRTQNAKIEFAISLKTQKRNLFTTHLNMGLWYMSVIRQDSPLIITDLIPLLIMNEKICHTQLGFPPFHGYYTINPISHYLHFPCSLASLKIP